MSAAGAGRTRRKLGWGGIALAAAILAPSRADAIERDRAGWYHTGDAVMTRSLIVIEVDVFAIGHDMRCLPDRRLAADVVAADCDKRLSWRTLRHIDKQKIRDSLSEGYKSVDYADDVKIRRVLSAFTSDLDEGAWVTITYDAAKAVTTFRPQTGAKVDIPGVAFMRATWSILFANPDMRDVGQALVSRL